MAWDSLPANQMVSFFDMQESRIALKQGQVKVDSNQCITKDEALTMYEVNEDEIRTYAPNQLIPKTSVRSFPIELCYDATAGINACNACPPPDPLPYSFFTKIKDNSTGTIAGGSWGGGYTVYLCPVKITYSDIPGVEDITTRSIYGNTKLKNIRLLTATTQITNLTIEVASDYISTFTQSPYVYAFANLYYRVAPSSASENGTRFNYPPVLFPNSPSIDSRNGGEVPILNSNYSAVVPTINVGETLYVYWEVTGTNAFNDYSGFYYKSFTIKLTT